MTILVPTPIAQAVAEATDEIRESFRPPTNTLFLHRKQMEVYSDKRRFKVVVAGRRWGKCLHTGSMIEMSDGTRRPIEAIVPGDTVLTVNEDTYELQPRKVVAVESNGVKETVVVKTAQRQLRSTPHHPILANNTWINAGELKVGDLIAVPKRLAFGSGNLPDYLPVAYDDFIEHLRYKSEEKGKLGGYNNVMARDLPAALRDGLNSWRKQTRTRVSAARYEALRGFSDGFFDPIAHGDVAWEEVTEVEQAEKAMTWDLSVEGNHNFIANGIVVHNTQLAKTSLIKFARKKKRLIWYVAPSYRMAKQIMWPELVEAIPRAWVKKFNETILTITLVNGTKIELKGADNPDSLRGVGIHYLVMDEVQDIDPEAWKKVLRPTLASTGGHALFIGCVRGDTKVLTRGGPIKIETLSKGEQEKTILPIDLELYGINRSYHKADGFWNNGVVETRKIDTKYGFQIEASEPHPIMVMKEHGTPVWKRTDQIEPGDRVAIGRGMEQWGGSDPLAGLDEHLCSWRKQFQGKRGPKPTALENNE